MTRRPASFRARWYRIVDTIFDAIGVRPIGIIVLGASGFAALQLFGMSLATVRTEAVTQGQVIDHPATVDSFVTAVFVRAGDRVAEGTPLAELSPYFIDQELRQLTIEAERLINEKRLEQARLLVGEERWLEPGIRSSPKRPSLEAPTEAYYVKQLEVLEARRQALLEDRESLVVRARFSGVVTAAAWLGASIAAGASVATISPEHADMIVAYVPAFSDVASVAHGSHAYIVGPQTEACRAPGRVRSRGARVVQAPGQLDNLLRGPLHGTPVHIDVPEGCELGIGRVLSLDLRTGEAS